MEALLGVMLLVADVDVDLLIDKVNVNHCRVHLRMNLVLTKRCVYAARKLLEFG